MANKLMDSILENSINQGLKNNFKSALENVGVKVPSNLGMWCYPNIIRDKLVANTINGINIIGEDCINISYSVDNDIMNYKISTCIDTDKLKRPVWVSNNINWDKALTVQDIFNDLFKNILPNISGVYAGDTTSTNDNGEDNTDWKHELFGESGKKTGLKQNSQYLRLYLISQPEPLYIYIDTTTNDITGKYNVSDSDTVSFKVDDASQKITAHINVISETMLETLI